MKSDVFRYSAGRETHRNLPKGPIVSFRNSTAPDSPFWIDNMAHSSPCPTPLFLAIWALQSQLELLLTEFLTLLFQHLLFYTSFDSMYLCQHPLVPLSISPILLLSRKKIVGSPKNLWMECPYCQPAPSLVAPLLTSTMTLRVGVEI